MKRKEQNLLENLRHHRKWTSGGHVTKNGGSEERNGDNGEGGVGQHGLDGRASGLESWQGGEIKTRGGELEVKRHGGRIEAEGTELRRRED